VSKLSQHVLSGECSNVSSFGHWLRAALMIERMLCDALIYDKISIFFEHVYTICPADIATAGSLGRRRAGQLRFGFVAVSAGHIVYKFEFCKKTFPIFFLSKRVA
jgi:hypothetical protein